MGGASAAGHPARVGRTLSIVALLAVLAAPERAGAQDFLNGAAPEPLGYGVYRGTVYELGYTFELAPWASGDGRQPVYLSGLSFTEHRGPFINLLTMVLALAGVASSTGHYERRGNTVYHVVTAEEARQAEEAMAAIAAGANAMPMTMRLRAYHDSLGSMAEGVRADVGVGSTIGDDPVPIGSFYVGGFLNWLRSNRNWDLNDGLREPFEAVFGGIMGELHITLWHFLGLFTRASLGYGSGGGDRFLALIELGADIHIGNRFFLSGAATLDVVRPELPDALGARVDGGVRF